MRSFSRSPSRSLTCIHPLHRRIAGLATVPELATRGLAPVPSLAAVSEFATRGLAAVPSLATFSGVAGIRGLVDVELVGELDPALFRTDPPDLQVGVRIQLVEHDRALAIRHKQCQDTGDRC